jgi:hypothetical protein
MFHRDILALALSDSYVRRHLFATVISVFLGGTDSNKACDLVVKSAHCSQSEMHHETTNKVNNDLVSLQLVGSEELRMSHVRKAFLFCACQQDEQSFL